MVEASLTCSSFIVPALTPGHPLLPRKTLAPHRPPSDGPWLLTPQILCTRCFIFSGCTPSSSLSFHLENSYFSFRKPSETAKVPFPVQPQSSPHEFLSLVTLFCLLSSLTSLTRLQVSYQGLPYLLLDANKLAHCLADRLSQYSIC